jgi:hypothetical protein
LAADLSNCRSVPPPASLALQAGVEEMGAGTVEFETGRRGSVIASGGGDRWVRVDVSHGRVRRRIKSREG